MNAPDRFESFLLAEGEKKIEVTQDTRTPNTAIFKFNKEDHTLGNLINRYLHKMDTILFTGYQVPHPNEPVMIMRVQTDGSLTPQEAIIKACEKSIADLAVLSREFTKEWELKKIANAGTGAGGAGAGGVDGA